VSVTYEDGEPEFLTFQIRHEVESTVTIHLDMFQAACKPDDWKGKDSDYIRTAVHETPCDFMWDERTEPGDHNLEIGVIVHNHLDSSSAIETEGDPPAEDMEKLRAAYEHIWMEGTAKP